MIFRIRDNYASVYVRDKFVFEFFAGPWAASALYLERIGLDVYQYVFPDGDTDLLNIKETAQEAGVWLQITAYLPDVIQIEVV
jgi:hypothetical protein